MIWIVKLNCTFIEEDSLCFFKGYTMFRKIGFIFGIIPFKD
jgi:hypothetical protein